MASFGPLISQRFTDQDRADRDRARGEAQPRGMEPDDISLGGLMRGMGIGNEPPAQSREEITTRAQRNAGFLQQPEIQAAMLQFAVNIMQPLGSGAGWGDFAGAF